MCDTAIVWAKSAIPKNCSKVHIIIADSGYYADYMNELKNYEPVNSVLGKGVYPEEKIIDYIGNNYSNLFQQAA